MEYVNPMIKPSIDLNSPLINIIMRNDILVSECAKDIVALSISDVHEISVNIFDAINEDMLQVLRTNKNKIK